MQIDDIMQFEITKKDIDHIATKVEKVKIIKCENNREIGLITQINFLLQKGMIHTSNGEIEFKYSNCIGFNANVLKEGYKLEYNITKNDKGNLECVHITPAILCYQWGKIEENSMWSAFNLEKSLQYELDINPNHESDIVTDTKLSRQTVCIYILC